MRNAYSFQGPHHDHRDGTKENAAPNIGDGFANDVKLVFGRPNIRDYLLGIFFGDGQGMDNDVERPAPARNGGTRPPRQVCYSIRSS